MTNLRIGVDVGGTFTDIVAINEYGEIFYTKTPSTPSDQSKGVMNGIDKILFELNKTPSDIVQIVHGTTVATNALLERKGSSTGLITTKGFKDVLHIGRQDRPELYDLKLHRPEPIIPRKLRYEVDERILYNGEVEMELDSEEFKKTLNELIEEGIESIAICFLHSYSNPINEKKALNIAKELSPNLSISISSEILSEFREFERMSTTVINAYVQYAMKRYISRLGTRLQKKEIKSPLMIMQSNGGMMGAESSYKRAINTLLSGPAGGVLGASFLSKLIPEQEFITADVGGTSFDVAIVEGGNPVMRTESLMDHYPIKFPHVDIHTIGAGGGSIAWIDSGGGLRVGPKSAGSEPGPVCYGRGGKEPTVCDAHAVLGRLDVKSLSGSDMELDIESAKEAIEKSIANPLNLTIEEAAEGILKVANASMCRAINTVTVERGKDPRNFTLLPYGGAGPLHATDIARDLGISKVLVPVSPGNFSAFGGLSAPVRYDEVSTYRVEEKSINFNHLEKVFQELYKKVILHLENEGFESKNISFSKKLDIRYFGQAFELTVPFYKNNINEFNWKKTVDEFHKTHHKLYGFSDTKGSLELVNVRLTGTVSIYPPKLKKINNNFSETLILPSAERDVYLEGCWMKTKIYNREHLIPGRKIEGPLVIEDKGSTLVVNRKDYLIIDDWGNLIVNIYCKSTNNFKEELPHE